METCRYMACSPRSSAPALKIGYHPLHIDIVYFDPCFPSHTHYIPDFPLRGHEVGQQDVDGANEDVISCWSLVHSMRSSACPNLQLKTLLTEIPEHRDMLIMGPMMGEAEA